MTLDNPTTPNKRVILKKLSIQNLGPIQADEVELGEFTYFVGRNNAGKSHYLKAVELLLATKTPSSEEIFKIQNDKTRPVLIEGTFVGAEEFIPQVAKSNHQEAIRKAIVGGELRLIRVLNSQPDEENKFGLRDPATDEVLNPSGLATNLLKILPEPISIVATADTLDELGNKANTAISKLKREVLGSFFLRLKEFTKSAFQPVDEFLHSQEGTKRSGELANFESELKAELVGEFAEVSPSIEFTLPDQDVIASEMKLFLDDGYRSEVEQKGHGLQRATLLALLRLLARQGERFRERPAPMFLIGELETFLHPYAQKKLGQTLNDLADRYQIITTTHSPFILTPETIEGYRRVRKGSSGTENIKPNWMLLNADRIRRHLEWRGNLEALFADRVVLIEGDGDELFYEKLLGIFAHNKLPGKFTIFVKMLGSKEIHLIRQFYLAIGVEDVAAILDLDCVFSSKFKQVLLSLKIDPSPVDNLRSHIGWSQEGDPKLAEVVEKVAHLGEPPELEALLRDLETKRIYVLRHGAPEHYSRIFPGQKKMLYLIDRAGDLTHPDYLSGLLRKAVQG